MSTFALLQGVFTMSWPGVRTPCIDCATAGGHGVLWRSGWQFL